jgi:hypothetical protein
MAQTGRAVQVEHNGNTITTTPEVLKQALSASQGITTNSETGMQEITDIVEAYDHIMVKTQGIRSHLSREGFLGGTVYCGPDDHPGHKGELDVSRSTVTGFDYTPSGISPGELHVRICKLEQNQLSVSIHGSDARKLDRNNIYNVTRDGTVTLYNDNRTVYEGGKPVSKGEADYVLNFVTKTFDFANTHIKETKTLSITKPTTNYSDVIIQDAGNFAADVDNLGARLDLLADAARGAGVSGLMFREGNKEANYDLETRTGTYTDGSVNVKLTSVKSGYQVDVKCGNAQFQGTYTVALNGSITSAAGKLSIENEEYLNTILREMVDFGYDQTGFVRPTLTTQSTDIGQTTTVQAPQKLGYVAANIDSLGLRLDHVAKAARAAGVDELTFRDGNREGKYNLETRTGTYTNESREVQLRFRKEGYQIDIKGGDEQFQGSYVVHLDGIIKRDSTENKAISEANEQYINNALREMIEFGYEMVGQKQQPIIKSDGTLHRPAETQATISVPSRQETPIQRNNQRGWGDILSHGGAGLIGALLTAYAFNIRQRNTQNRAN